MKSHRGIAAIVGIVFLVAVVVVALGYITYSLETMANFSETLIAEESRQKNIQDEEFQITSVDITSDKLDATIKNTGQIPLKIDTLYIDEQGINDIVQKIVIDKTIAPGGSIGLIDESFDIDVNGTKGYTLKMITSSGESQIFYVNSASTEPLFMNLITAPKMISSDFSATILFTVVNNMSNNNRIYNLVPEISVKSPNGLATYQSISGPTPTSYPVLDTGDVAIFEYVYTVAGDEGNAVNFGLSLVDGYEISPGNIQHLNSTVAIKVVELALKSGSALTSFGLESFDNQALDLLIFHDETNNTPNNGSYYQMDASDAAGAGSTFNSFDDMPIIFFTANMTQEVNMTAPSTWNATLQYYSDFTDPSIPEPDMAFFFECFDCTASGHTGEATGNAAASADDKKSFGSLKEDGDSLPTWRDPLTVLDGPHGDGYMSFTDNDGFLEGEWKVDDAIAKTTIGAPPDTDALWIRIPTSGIDDYMPVVSWIDDKDPGELYVISIGSSEGVSNDTGKISFNYGTHKDLGTESTTCTSPDYYDNGNWQHIVAVRESNGDCNLYVNGSKVAGPVSGNTGTNTVDIKNTGMGTIEHAKSLASNDLLADVALWMHWDSDALNSTQVSDLFHTNYGKNASRIWITINQTDGNGGMDCAPNCESYIDTKAFSMPFHDPSVNSPDDASYYASYLESESDSYLKYTNSNFTGLVSGIDRVINLDHRLSLRIQTDDSQQNLPINIRVDDANFPAQFNFDISSFLQTGEMQPSIPTYLTIGVDERVNLTIFNEGPEGLWFTFPGTRLVLTSLDGVTSYGAMPEFVSVNDGADRKINYKKDGPYIADQNTAGVKFYPLTDPPEHKDATGTAAAPVVPGEYQAAVYLSGYDEAGEAFLRTIKLGSVQIVE